MKKIKYTKELLNKYYQNEISDNEKSELFELLHINNFSEEEKEQLMLFELWEKSGKEKVLSDEKATRIFQSVVGTSTNKPGFKYHWNIAAVIALLICAGAAIIIFTLQNNALIYQTGIAEVKEIELSDGSKVFLNANSLLEIPFDFASSNSRSVVLQGEGYFQIQKSAAQKTFIVHVNGVSVIVLGTQFNVVNRRGTTKVLLEEGKVVLNIPHVSEGLVMKPGDFVEYSEDKKIVEHKQVNPDIHTSWKQKQLKFIDTPLYEIAQLLEDTHNLKMEFEDSLLANREFTGTYPYDKVNILLKALEKSFDVEIKKEEEKLLMQRSKQ